VKRKSLILSFLSITYLFCSGQIFQAATDCPQINYDDITDAGSYPVNLYYEENGKGACRTIYVTLHQRHTTEEKEKHEAINAHDILIEHNTFQTLSDQSLIKLTKARAWDTQTNTDIPLHVSNRRLLDNKTGYYQVTFTTNNNTQTTISVIETEQTETTTTYLYTNLTNPKNILWNWLGLTLLILLFPILIFFLVFHYQRKKVQQVTGILY